MSSARVDAGPSLAEGETMSKYKLRLVVEHILAQLAVRRRAPSLSRGEAKLPPLIVGMQGPQGSGKTTLTHAIKEALAESPHLLSTAIFSIDDLYLPHEGLVAVARSDPSNVLLSGRGQPGTHDVALGTQILEQLSHINEPPRSSDVASPEGSTSPMRSVTLPTFDKSLFDGEGDRSHRTVHVEAPLDVVLFEGWCLGFAALPDAELVRRYEEQKQSRAKIEAERRRHVPVDAGTALTATTPYFLRHSLDHLRRVNASLANWSSQWYPHLDAFVQLVPTRSDTSRDAGRGSKKDSGRGGGEGVGIVEARPSAEALETVFEWRQQAERAMKAENGGRGMSEEQVRSFVARYMPGYELFSEGVADPYAPWAGHGLRLGLDEARNVTGVCHF